MLKREDILREEKVSLLLYMKYRKSLTITESAGKVKNTSGSENCRKLGNELYKRRPHDSSTHENIWNYYSESIALAPNNSEDLAMGYGNRSALFFHIKKYKECITDIDRALSITSNNLLKVKLLSRKAESLMMLKESIEFVCEEALQILQQFQESERMIYTAKLNQLLVKEKKIESDIKLPEKDSSIKDLLNFERSKEIPSASKSVAIKYDKKWGRHVVAKEDIKPGDIISVHKPIFTHIGLQKMYLYCSYCAIIAYNSLPCEFCIYSIYCSEACRAMAWKEYHQYECVIYQHSTIISHGIVHTRFVLSAIYEVGSIDQMKDHILEIENTIDPRIKGFSNGIFDIEQKKNVYSLTNANVCLEDIQHNLKYSLIADICNCVYVLAKFTNFFGQIKNVLEPEVLLNEDRLFIAALILRTFYAIRVYRENLPLKYGQTPIDLYTENVYLELFISLINHSCHNNVKTIRINGGKNITIACQPIRKGSQLFKNMNLINFFIPKKLRQSLLKVYDIACECIACTEDWSPICVPSIEQFFQITPTLDISILERNRILLKQIDPKHGFSRYTKNLLNQVCHHLAVLDEKFTTVCFDYYIFLRFLEDLMYEVFSEYYFEMPGQCE